MICQIEDWARAGLLSRLQECAELRLRIACGPLEPILEACFRIQDCFRRGGKLLIFGNGGSAADAQHIAAEFVGRFALERVPLPALALTTDTSVLTAVANDYGFEQVFSRQIDALAKSEDIAIALSTSGKSQNVLCGIRAARNRGLCTIGLSGCDGGSLAGCVDCPILVPSDNTARIQECHITIGHLICEMVELMLAGAAETAVKSSPNIAGSHKIVPWSTLLGFRNVWRAAGKQVVWTNGCFDLLHVGHVHSLQAARRLGDVLIVGINTDESVRKLKGIERPINPAKDRAEVVAALDCVTHVCYVGDPTPAALLAELKPDIHCKGADYAPPNGKPIPEAAVVSGYGGRVEYLPITGYISTSQLIARIRALDRRDESAT